MSRSDDGERLDSGTAGASARREHARRKASRERAVRAKHPRIGGVLLALQDEPSHERAWATGAAGEERVAKLLAKYLDARIALLHDRRIPGTRANIDHIAVAASGVWVIDAKCYKGQKVTVERPLFGKPKLLIGRRDKTRLIDGVQRQVEAASLVVSRIAPGTPVRGALCFSDAELPLIGRLRINDFELLYPRQLAKRINRPGPVCEADSAALAVGLASHFTPA
jgi:hypothetical protein